MITVNEKSKRVNKTTKSSVCYYNIASYYIATIVVSYNSLIIEAVFWLVIINSHKLFKGYVWNKSKSSGIWEFPPPHALNKLSLELSSFLFGCFWGDIVARCQTHAEINRSERSALRTGLDTESSVKNGCGLHWNVCARVCVVILIM